MKKILTLLLGTCLICSCSAPQYSWKKISVAGRLTGVTASTASNVPQTMGRMEGDTYYAPSGKTFEKGTLAADNAEIMLGLQPRMADLKQVVATCPSGMSRSRRENGVLPWWYIDVFMKLGSEYFGCPVDVGVVNFGGIRQDMPAGDVLKDDIVSMFPFKNSMILVTLTGEKLLEFFNDMATHHFQVVGGVEATVRNHKLEQCLVGGSPVDLGRTYNLVTIDFLLNGGDGLCIEKYASSITRSDKYVIDFILPYVMSLGEQGIPIEYEYQQKIKEIR